VHFSLQSAVAALENQTFGWMNGCTPVWTYVCMEVVIFYILADLIYPSEDPLVTPYSVAQLTNQPPNEQAQSRQLNAIIRHYVGNIVPGVVCWLGLAARRARLCSQL
jgi:hypothetical protein